MERSPIETPVRCKMRRIGVLACLCVLTLRTANAASDIQLNRVAQATKPVNSKVNYEFTITADSTIALIDHISLYIVKGTTQKSSETNATKTILGNEPVPITFEIDDGVFEGVVNVTITVNHKSSTAASVNQVLTVQVLTPKLTYVGANTEYGHKDTVRIETDIDIDVYGVQCERVASPCFIFGYNMADNPPICTTAIDGNGYYILTTEQCDYSNVIEPSNDLNPVNSVQLLYTSGDTTNPSMMLNASFNNTSVTMEATFHDGINVWSTKNCTLVSNTCDLRDLQLPPTTDFGILMVTFDDKKAIVESTAFDFEDYKTFGHTLVDDLLEVTWNGKEQNYSIKLDPVEPLANYSEISMKCGENDGSNCKAYFSGLAPGNYTASVCSTESNHFVVYEGDTSNSDDLTELIITRFTLTLSEKDSSNFSLSLKPEKEVKDVNKIVLAVVSKNKHAATEIVSIATHTENIKNDTETVVDFQIENFVNDEVLYLVVTARGDQDYALAVGRVEADFKDFVMPEMNEVGTEDPNSKWLRVHTGGMELMVNGIDCTANNATYIFMDKNFHNPVLVCREAGINLDLDKTEIEQCDSTQVIQKSTGGVTVNKAQLTHPYKTDGEAYMDVEAKYDSASTTAAEGVFIQANEPKLVTKCSPFNVFQKSCHLENLPNQKDQTEFDLLIVGLNHNGIVEESTLISFEDYGTEIKPLTDQIIEVRWNTNEVDRYRISVDLNEAGQRESMRWDAAEEGLDEIRNDEDNAVQYKELSISCGGNNIANQCKGYFIDLAVNGSYTASVKKDPAGEDNIVASEVEMSDKGDIPTLTITNLTQIRNGDQDASTFRLSLKASKTEVADIHQIVLAIITGGQSTTYEGHAANTKGQTDINNGQAADETLGILEMNFTLTQDETHFDFNIEKENLIDKDIVIVVTAHGSAGSDLAKAVGMVQANFKDIAYPQVNEVGKMSSKWIRVNMGNMPLLVNGRSFTNGSTFYYPEDTNSQTPQLVLCTIPEAGTNLDGTRMDQCDQTQDIGLLNDNINVTRAEMIHPSSEGDKSSMDLTAEYGEDSKSLDVVFTNEKDVVCPSHCKTSISRYSSIGQDNCTLTNLDIPPAKHDFTILVVGLSANGDVTESTSFYFEDYKTASQQLTARTLEVRWRADIQDNYTTRIGTHENLETYSGITLNCGGDDLARCKTYFVDLKISTTYTGSVLKDDETNIVSASTHMSILPTVPHLTINKLTEETSEDADKGNFSISLSAAKGQVENVTSIAIAFITQETNGQEARETIIVLPENTALDVQENEFNIEADKDFLTTENDVFVLVTTRGDDDLSPATGVGQVKADFKEISIKSAIQVGNSNSTWVRAETSTMAVTIDGTHCKANAVCLIHPDGDASQPLFLCTKAGENLNKTEMQQCKTYKPEPVIDTITVQSAKLERTGEGSLTSFTLLGEYNNTDANLLEGFVIDDNGNTAFNSTCDITPLREAEKQTGKTCRFENLQIQTTGNVYNLLFVGLNSSHNISDSTAIYFEDYQTEIQALSEDIIEVRWNSLINEEHVITLETSESRTFSETIPYDNLPGASTQTTLTCGGNDNDKCKGYYIGLDPRSTYQASVKKSKKKDGNDNIVAASINMASATDYLPIQLAISEFTQISTEDKDGFANFTITMATIDNTTVATVIAEKLVLAIVSNDLLGQQEVVDVLVQNVTLDGTKRDFQFAIDKKQLIQHKVVNILVTAHESADNDPALAVAKANATFKDLTFPDVNEVGSTSFKWIRVKTGDMPLTINGEHYEADKTTYSKDDNFKSPILMCRPAGTNIDGSPVQQCDKTRELEKLVDTVNVTNAELIHPYTIDANSTMEFNAAYNKNDSETVEGVFTHGNKQLFQISRCDLASNTQEKEGMSKICILNDLDIQQSIVDLSIIFVGLSKSNGKVTESTSISFKDYKTKALPLTNNIVEVRWNAESEDQTVISLNQNVSGAFSEVSMTCGGNDNAACLSYFLDLDGNKEYTASVQTDPQWERNMVAASVNMTKAENLTMLTITRITELVQANESEPNFEITLMSSEEDLAFGNITLTIVKLEKEGQKAREYNIKGIKKTKADGEGYGLEAHGASDVDLWGTESVFQFVINRTLLFSDSDLFLVVTAQDSSSNGNVTAVGMIKAKITEIEIGTINEVGTKNKTWVRIVTGNDKIWVNSVECKANKSNYFQNNGSFAETVSVCRNASVLRGFTLMQCQNEDVNSKLPGNFDINKLHLIYASGVEGQANLAIDVQMIESATKMEGVINYEKDVISQSNCTLNTSDDNTANICSLDNLKIQTNYLNYDVLMVALDSNGDVVNSSIKPFEDYKTMIQSLTSNLSEVRWKAPGDSNATYTISLDGDVDSRAYTSISVTCGGVDNNAECKSYFVGLQPQGLFIASIVKQDGDQNNIVSSQINITNPAAVPFMTIASLTAIPQDNEDTETYNMTLKANSTEVTGANQIILAIVNQDNDNKMASETNFQKESVSLNETGVNLSFNISKNQLQNGDNVYIIVTAHNVEGGDSAKGIALVKPEFKDMSDVDVNIVGTNESKWLRVKPGSLDMIVDGTNCSKGKPTYIKPHTGDEDDLNLCRDAGTNLDGNPMLQCTLQHKANPLVAMSPPTSVQLTYPYKDLYPTDSANMTFSGPFKINSTHMELTFIFNSKVSATEICSLTPGEMPIEKNCTITSVPDTSPDRTFSIIMVATDNNTVIESNEIEFEDYQVKVIPFTSDTMEVMWTPKEVTTYYIYLDQEVTPPNTNDDRVSCGGDNSDSCVSYFGGLQAQTDYKVSVKELTGGDCNIVEIWTRTPSSENEVMP